METVLGFLGATQHAVERLVHDTPQNLQAILLGGTSTADTRDEKYFLMMWVLFAAFFIGYWALNGLFFLAWKLNLAAAYKIQPDLMPTQNLINRELFDNIFVAFAVLAGMTAINFRLGLDAFIEWNGPYPSVFQILWQIGACFVFYDTCFYWMHRTLHHPRIYKYFHKQHHGFKVSVGISSSYALPLENLMQILIMFYPPFYLAWFTGGKVHIATFFWNILFREMQTVDAHCGYDIPWSPFRLVGLGGALPHDFHHAHNTGNYGAMFFWDWIMGTDKTYREWLKKYKIGDPSNNSKIGVSYKVNGVTPSLGWRNLAEPKADSAKKSN